MQNSASECEVSKFGVYSSSGRFLQGSERFKGSWEYGELAKQLDIKRSALYAEARGSEFLLGCSLLVKIRKGREERVVFMECFPKEAVSEDPGWLNRFYTEAITRTEELRSIRYQVLGLWKEGDIYTLSPQDKPEKTPACLERKVLLGEQVSVWTSDLSGGLFFLAHLIFKLKPVFLPGFNLAFSLYPSRTDVSAGPGEPNPDFTLEGGEIRFSAPPSKKASLEMLSSKTASSELLSSEPMASREEAAARVQKGYLKEQKEVFSPDDALCKDYSKAREAALKKKKRLQRKKIVLYAFSFSLILIAGLLLLSKAGVELPFPSVNLSKNNGTGFLPFTVSVDGGAENVSPELQGIRKESNSINNSSGGVENKTERNETAVNIRDTNVAVINITEANKGQMNVIDKDEIAANEKI